MAGVDSDKYDIQAFDKNDTRSILRYHFFKVGDTLFLDTTLGKKKKEKVGKWFLVHVVPLHCLSKVAIINDCIKVIPLDYEWLAKLIDQKKFVLPYIKADKHIIYHASSEQWLELLKKYHNTLDAFPEESALFFVRPSKQKTR